jgi:hypothetical protein
MTKWEKALFGLNIILVAIICYLIFGFANSVENCWDKYHTEESAITYCENHNA